MKRALSVILLLSVCLTLCCGCNAVQTLEGISFRESRDVTNYVKIEMEDGGIILLELMSDVAPLTVANFQKLVSQQFYDGLIFHRVIPGFMIQGGDPLGTGYGNSEETIVGEFDANGIHNSLSHTRGVISMGRAMNNYNSASCQFFIVQSDYPSLDGQYAAFGKTLAGLDVVDAIVNQPRDSKDRPLQNQTMRSIRFIKILS